MKNNRNSLVFTLVVVALTGVAALSTTLKSSLVSAFHAVTSIQAPEPPRAFRVRTVAQSADKSGIPDTIALEVLLRVASRPNSENFLKQAGFTDTEMASILAEARDPASTLEADDARMCELREGAVVQPAKAISLEKDLADVRSHKNNFLSDVKNRFLPSTLKDAGMARLARFLDDVVRPNTKKVSFLETAQIASKGSKRGSVKRRELFVFAYGWQEGMNIYGSGLVIDDDELIESDNQYRIFGKG